MGSIKKPVATETEWRLDDVIARVVVFGKMEDRDGIGNLLSDSHHFFQHPMAGEVDTDVPYFNPHLLLRPGAQMPKIEGLSISESNAGTTAVSQLDEVNRGKIWMIFDKANCIADDAGVKPSGGLKSTLRELVTCSFFTGVS